MAGPDHRPTRPLDAYPTVTELPPLPPEGAPGEDAAPAPARADRPPPKVAVLRFLDPAARERRIPLKHPFVWDEEEVREIVVRRLNVAQVGLVMESYADDDPINVYDFLAAMTGVPAPVHRGMDPEDGEEVMTAARPLLPRYLDAILFRSPMAATKAAGSGTGGATPSPQPGP